MNKLKLIIAVSALLLTFMSMSVDASTVAYDFTWQVTQNSDSSAGVFSDISAVNVGDIFSGYFFVSESPDGQIHGNNNSVYVSINDFFLYSSSYEPFYTFFFNNTNQTGLFIQASYGIGFSYPRSPFKGYFSLWIDLGNPSDGTGNASLPSTLSLADFSIATVQVVVLGGPANPDSSFSLLGNVVSLTEVPVPSSLWLFSTGSLGLIGFAWRKNVDL